MKGLAFRIFLVGIVVSPMGSSLALSAERSREAPMNVAIHDLLETPDRYDGRRVLVTGFISSIEYAILTLEETAAGVTPAVYAVKVISLTFPRVSKCQHAVVQGTYHRQGKQAGRPYEFFIDAEAVLQDDPAGSKRVPSECEEKL
jgi:hypothetical protein